MKTSRIFEFIEILKRKRISVALIFGEANIQSLTGIRCDNGCLVVKSTVPAKGAVSDPVSRMVSVPVTFITDFRYVPMVHRVAPELEVIELKKGKGFAETIRSVLSKEKTTPKVVGFEGSISANRYLQLQKVFKKSKLVDAESLILALRAVKTMDEIARIAEAEALNDKIWKLSQKEFSFGMTEKEIQRIIRAWMNALGDGEAFETIVCAGSNAAECHHVPDDTVWEKGQPLLVDMGVKFKGVCSDMTRCIKPKKRNEEYDEVYSVVLKANMTAISKAKAGITCGELDKIARDIISDAGYGKSFGHSLGHGVGYEIHELPTARPSDKTVLKPGMLVTIEPGIYIEGKLGIRIEDLVLITKDGCEVLSHSEK